MNKLSKLIATEVILLSLTVGGCKTAEVKKTEPVKQEAVTTKSEQENVAKKEESVKKDDSKSKELLKAAGKGEVAKIKELLEQGADINYKDSRGYTPVLKVLEKQNVEALKTILRAKPDLSINTPEGDSILMMANTPEVVNLLVKAGASVDKFNSKKRNNPLLNAVMKKTPEVVKALLENGADTEIKNARGQRPLTLAVLESKVEVAKMLIRESFINAIDAKGDTALSMATNEEIIADLLDSGVDISIRNKEGIISGRDAFMLSIEKGYNTAVRKFIERGINLNFIDSYGDTPLTLAVANRQKEVIVILLEGGADINKRDKKEMTPLQIAASKADKELVEFLISKGAEM